MITPFDFIERLRAWFFAKDRDITLQTMRKVVINGGDLEVLASGDIVITGGNITISAGGTVDGVDISVHAADSDAHHNESHSLASHTGSLSHDTDLSDVSANDHHNESHTVSSHSDTSATGSELNTLTNSSDASSLHYHDSDYFHKSEFSSNPGSNSRPIESNGSGHLELEGLGVGTSPTTNDIRAAADIVALNDVYATNDSRTAGDLKCGYGITVGNATAASVFGTIKLRETGTPATPASGYVYVWAATSGRVYSKDDTGTVRELSN